MHSVEVAIATGDEAKQRQRDYRAFLSQRRWLVIVAAGFISCLIIFSRRPDALLNPQFDAEDGTYFYAQAYNLGAVSTLTLPVAGYLITSARLVALIAMCFPMSWGPAIFNVFAILFQAAPVMFLMTHRFDHLTPSWRARCALAFFYLALPNSSELDAAMTYSQWHLALLAFLVIIAAPAPDRRWKTIDGLILLLAGLSGPFCFFLLPIILLRWLRTRAPFLLRLLAIDAGAAGVQAAVLLQNMSSGRAHTPLGANPVELARIVGGQMVLGATIGMKGFEIVSGSGWWATGWFPSLLVLVGAVFLIFALRRAPQELRLLWLYGASVFLAALVSPVNYGPWTYWRRLAHPTWGLRYEFLLIMAWLTTLVWILSLPSAPILRRVALVFLAFACLVAIPVDWEYPPFTDYHYQAYVQRFEQLPSGDHLIIPINSPGWTMTLIKH